MVTVMYIVLNRVARCISEKIAQNIAKQKIIHTLYHGEKSSRTVCATSVIFKKLSKVNNRSILAQTGHPGAERRRKNSVQ
jgi:hypothetical protein